MKLKQLYMIIIVLSFFSLKAQELNNIPSPNYPYINYSVDDGLPQSIVSGIMQDSYGYVWLATSEGLAKFDGQHFQVYNFSTGYPFEVVTGVVENKPGELWVASYRHGLFRLRNDKYERIIFDSLETHSKINSITKTNDGEILLCTEPGGFYVFNHDSLVLHLKDQDGPLKTPVSRATKDAMGRYWIGSYYDGVRVFKGRKLEFRLTKENGLPSNEIRSIYALNKDEIWIGTNKGLFIYGNPQLTDQWNKLFLNAFVSSIYSKDNKNLWVNLSSDPGGVVHVANNHIIEVLRLVQPFYSNCTLLSESGTLFIGTYQGLFVCPNRNFENFGHRNGLTDVYIRTINKDCHGNLLVATRGSGLFRLVGNQFQSIGTADSAFTGNSVYDFKPFHDKLWVASARGLYLLKNYKILNKDFLKLFKGITVRRLAIINDQLYIITKRHIYRLINDMALQDISYNLRNIDISLWGLNRDRKNNLVAISNGQGIWVKTDTTWTQLKTAYTIKKVLSIRKDDSGILYFATDNGIFKWDGETFRAILTLKQIVWDILPTRNNGIWLLTSKGLYQFKDGAIKIYNKKNGIIATEFNMGAAFRLNDNDCWFGGVEGLVHFKKKVDYKKVVPRFYISSISTKDTTLFFPFRTKIVFKAHNNAIKIKFHQINFGSLANFEFAYWLEGLNKDTIYVRNSEIDFVNYTSLPYGDYTFHLFLVNPLTNVIEKEKTVSFNILPPWWKSVWFILLLVIAFALFVGLIVRWRVSILEKRNLLLEKQVEERTQDIQLSYKLLKKETEERKKAEVSLFKEREQLAITLKSIADGVIRTDLQGNIQLMNFSAEEMLKIKLQDAINKNLNDLLELQNEETDETISLPGYIQKFSDQEKHLTHFNAILKPKNSNLEKIVNISWSYVKDEKQNESGYVWVFRDISAERRLEDEMMRSQKLESIGLLAGGIAHDFNNILSGILGNAQLAQLALAAKKNIDKYLKGIIEATQNATRLTQQLLTFAKGGEPVMEVLDIKNLLEESVEFALRGSNISCTYDIDENLWAVEADKGQLNQVINNLVINAVQAMPGGGKLTVKAENYESTGTEKDLTELNGAYFVKLSFSDTGHGIAKENLKKIFDPYFTTKQKGSGLGLATTYAIIKKHGGKITVESELGKGTTFNVYLPAVPEYKVKEKEEVQTLTSWAGKRVLVMDDEEYIRDLMGSFLEMLDIEAEFAQNGEEAIEKYQQAMKNEHPFDAVIMDLTIRGGMGGKEAVQKILEIDSKAKVIVASGYSTDSVLANVEKFGFKGRLSKPFSLEELNKVLKSVLNN